MNTVILLQSGLQNREVCCGMLNRRTAGAWQAHGRAYTLGRRADDLRFVACFSAAVALRP